MAKKGLRDKRVGRNRNDLCPCGSGLKYKNCCKPMPRMKTDEERQSEIDERKKTIGLSAQAYVQYIQSLVKTKPVSKINVDCGDLPERVSIDE